MEDAVRVLQQQVNEFTDFDNQENVPNVDTLELTLFDVKSKSSQIWSKLRRNVRAHKFRLEMCGASQYKPNLSKSTSNVNVFLAFRESRLTVSKPGRSWK